MLNLDPNIFNQNIFWEAWKTAQNFNQNIFNFFDLLSKGQKIKNSQNLIGELAQEYVAYINYNASIANQLFTNLLNINNQEEFLKLQENIFMEYNEQNLFHLKKIMTMYHELFQDNYKNTKQHTEDFMHKYTQASEKIASTLNINPTTTKNNNQSSKKSSSNQ